MTIVQGIALQQDLQENKDAIAGKSLDVPAHTGDVKIVEAHTAILLSKAGGLLTRNDQTMWLLKHMLQPIKILEDEHFHLLYLSASHKAIWEPHTQPRMDDINGPVRTADPFTEASRIPFSSNNLPALTSSTTTTQPQPTNTNTNKKLYMLTPRTHILTVSQENRMVFLIDLSSSLATIDAGSNKIMMGNTYHVIENMIHGLVLPFTFRASPTSMPISLEPTIRITVIIECSQFGSNMNVIPILAEYPTMRVLLQNVVITQHNIYAVLKTLNEGIRDFQRDLGIFRKKLTERRAKLGYELDVRGDHSSVTEEGGADFDLGHLDARYLSGRKSNHQKKGTEKRKQTANSPHSPRPNTVTKTESNNNMKRWSGPYPGSATRPQQQQQQQQQQQPQQQHRSLFMSNHNQPRSLKHMMPLKKDVWGLGKTGSNLSYILRAGSFAMSLLPPIGRPSLILITDGVVKSNVQDEYAIRQLSSDDIACSVVQIGAMNSFGPGCNFGFVPDNEILRFLANATGGHFMHAEECPSVTRNDYLRHAGVSQTKRTHSSVDTAFAAPNIYHYRLLMREVLLDKTQAKMSRLLAAAGRINDPIVNKDPLSTALLGLPPSARTLQYEGMLPMQTNGNAPWTYGSELVPADTRLLRFQEYYLPTEFWHAITARLHQGFSLSSVLFDDSRHRRGTNHTEELVKKERILITLTLNWQPDITIEYRIRAYWSSPWSDYLRSLLMNVAERTPSIQLNAKDTNFLSEHHLLDCVRSPKAEVLIRANSTFSHMLQNWDAFQRRSQMMGIFTGSLGIGRDFSASPGFLKVGKLKKLLVRISETDELLKSLVSVKLDQGPKDLCEKFQATWTKMDGSEFRPHTRCWYDDASFDIILKAGCSSEYTYNTALLDTFQIEAEDAVQQMHRELEKWATFTSKDHTYVKLFMDASIQPTHHDEQLRELSTSPGYMASTVEATSPQFCEARLFQDKQRIINVRILFFNLSMAAQQQVTDDLKSIMTRLPVTVENALIHPGVKYPASPSGKEHAVHSMDQRAMICQRPLSSLLLRDFEHYMSSEAFFEKQQLFMTKMWHINPTFWLNGEFIVRNYLHHSAWHWHIEGPYLETDSFTKLKSLQELAYSYICKARLTEGFHLVAVQRAGSHFYKEMYHKDTAFAMQYYVWYEPTEHKVITELWMEPIVGETTNDTERSLIRSILHKDKDIMTRLITFDRVYSLGLPASITTPLDKANQHANETDTVTPVQLYHMQQSCLFNVASILQLATFLLASYPCPKFDRYSLIKDQKHWATPTDSSPLFDIKKTPMPTATAENATSRNLERTSSRSRTNSKMSPVASPLNQSQVSMWHNHRHYTCNCPRPDTLFYRHKDAISALPPILRDIGLLHYYFEQSFSTIADSTIALDDAPHSEFWQMLMKTLAKEKLAAIDTSTLPITRHLQHMRCFVKIVDPGAFILILMPSLSVIVNHLFHQSHLSEQEQLISSACSISPSGFDHMSLLIFECQRQNPASDVCYRDLSDLLKEPITMNPIDHTVWNEWIEGIGSALRPNLSWGRLGCPLPNDGLSERTLRLMQDITSIYFQSFVKSIFTCLLHGRAVDGEDFEKVLEICDESSLDIDLTGYLNAQTLLKRRGRISVDELELAHQRFISVLSHYFEPVITTNVSRQHNIYCYRPPFAKVGQKLGFSLSGENPSNLTDVVVCAQNPLFIRLEYTLRKPKPSGGGFDEITLPVHQLPSSYEGECPATGYFNFESEAIGSDDSPVDSSDGTSATLHLVCMTLPRIKNASEDLLFSHLQGCPADSTVHHQTPFLDTEKTYRPNLSSLTRDKQDALIETEARLIWLFTEEIMHGLLRSGPITQSVVRYIEAQLMKKNPFVDFPTTMFIPLVFVKNQQLSRQIFFEELEKVRNMPYRLMRVGDCFYASDHDALHTEPLPSTMELEPHYDDELDGLNISMESSGKADNNSSQGGSSDEFCQGLGISILEPETVLDEEASRDADGDRETADVMRQQLYWLLLIPQRENVQIYFYSKMQQSVNRSEIIRVTKAMVNDVIRRTNKLVLLQELHETRICSKYLLAPGEEGERQQYSSDEYSEEEYELPNSHRSGDNLVEILSTSGEEPSLAQPKKFQPGQFGCGIVFTKSFPLHWRLQPNFALNSLSNDVLRNLAVKNRPNMFVCMRDNAVVYCFLSETTVTHYLFDSDVQMEQENMLRPISPFGNTLTSSNNEGPHSRIQNMSFSSHGKQSPQGSAHSDLLSPRASPGKQEMSPNGTKKSVRSFETRELRLQVHGVDLPSWISEELVDLLESRLTIQITMKEVQQFLMRNPTSKLSRADLEFILPIEKPPSFRQSIRIPLLIADIYHFLHLLRQNILIGPLRALNGTDLSYLVKRYRMLRYGTRPPNAYPWSSKETRDRHDHPDIVAGDLCFYYSCFNRAPGVCSPFEMMVGQGVAGICMNLLHAKSKTAVEDDPIKIDHMRGIYMHDLDACLEDQLSDDRVSNHRYELAVDIWSVGQIETSHLFDHVYSCFRQTICDYIIEWTVRVATREKNDKRFDRHVARETIDPSCTLQEIVPPFVRVLEKAAEWKSPSVKSLSITANLSPWCLEDIVLQLEAELTDCNPMLRPVIARATDMCDLNITTRPQQEYEVLESPAHFPRHNEPPSLHSSHFLMVSGLAELHHRWFPTPGGTRRQSADSEWSQKSHSRSPLGKNAMNEEAQRKEGSPLRRDDLSIHSRHDSLASGMSKTALTTLNAKLRGNYKDVSHRHSFMLFTLDTHGFTAYAYNCTDVFSDQILQSLLRSVQRQETRGLALRNILFQKMGLFHHSESMAEIMSAGGTRSPTLSQSTSTGYQHPMHRSAASPSFVGIARLAQLDSQVRTSPSATPSPSTDDYQSRTEVNFSNLKSLITNTYSGRQRSERTVLGTEQESEDTMSIFDVQENGKLCKPAGHEPSEVVYTAVRLTDANTVLRDAFAESTAEYEHARHRDYLIRHGEPFLNMYLRRSKLQAAHEKAFLVYSKWANRYEDFEARAPEEIEMMSFAELKLILKASRLLHFCRTPLYFSDATSSELNNAGRTARLFADPSMAKSEETTAWYERLTHNFMAEYASYLEGIGMHLIIHGPSNDQKEEVEGCLSRFQITDTVSVSSPVVYLLQVFKGGSIMCEARLTDGFVSVTLYTLHRRYGRLTFSPYTHEKREIRRAGFKTFTEECDRFKQRIHVNSFVSDFHLRHIQRSLDDSASLPRNLNLLNVLKNTVSIYDRPASYSRNRIVKGVYEIVVENKVDQLLSLILRDAAKFGFQTLYYENKPIACFVSSDDLSFQRDADSHPSTDSHFRHTLVIAPADSQWGNLPGKGSSVGSPRHMSAGHSESIMEKIELQYFVLVVYRKMDRPEAGNDVYHTTWSTTLRHKNEQRRGKNDEEILLPEQYTMGDVVRQAENRIDTMIAQAIHYCHQDTNWNRLYHAISTKRTKGSAVDLVTLARGFYSLDLESIDPSFSKFMRLNLRWDDVLDTMKLFYPMTSGEIRLQTTRYVLFFMPNAVMEYFVSFEYNPDDKRIKATMNSKQPRKDAQRMDAAERDFVTNLGNVLAYYIWKNTQ
ncbi:uncharacterized protein BYT42DRAFT_538912 [Radiomyces spectabilis]|uniref:uncharacterized protein n=1 Tax=Radiomyces spectabilis TaxID=64574 RepID=UPI00221F9ECF|nr:uncharacterized protein BYT42DRAFT_538912 [Radiomyces spectabilis]KAI8369527.1 hypothetical protein BYT42DRAFT_538912 [Radiomyces spectabilis]